MLQYITNLSAQEKENLILAPIWVSTLMAGVDGKIDRQELDRAMEVIHIKTYSEKDDIQDIFAETDKIAEDVIRKLIVNLPHETEALVKELSDKLEHINPILAKLDTSFAKKYVKSLKRLAYYVAAASGGIFGFNSVNSSEKEMMELSMLNEIKD